ncbi:MAG: cyclic nucleotide-binding domain-containing protein [Bauldia sp.]|uniref:cyclic nucleotide-binding domain-containing protein n=1 Tax=Bauldia sp. TaxID=2575872 RepID=UPI001DCBCB8F|nr:cyclic nucleotide-binding domain-containing protein [Bauldia sp.]MCB1496368.1 cyclic nucleotide-binding domain-containing protein [Bauldia sp.]
MREILNYCADIPIERFEAGAVLLEEGKWSGRLFILEDGEVEVDRGDTTVAVVGEPGSMFGEMSVLLDVPHTATVRAATAVTARVAEDGTAFMRRHPEVAFFLARLLAQRLNAATTYLVDLKQQFEGHGDHLGMVGEVLDALIHQQEEDFIPGSDREPDPRM